MNKPSPELKLNPSHNAAITLPRVWGLHATAMPTHAIEHSVLPVGFDEVGDLSEFVVEENSDREASERLRSALSERIDSSHENKKKMSTAMACSQLWKFLNVAQVGDYVAYPYDATGDEKCVYLGKITSGYFYEPSTIKYRNHRKVEWLPKTIPFKTLLSVTQSSLNIPQTFFHVSRDISACDILHRFGIVPSDMIEKIINTKKTFEQYVIDQLFAHRDGYQFQEFVADALRADGYVAKVTDKGADGGVDIWVWHDCEFIPVKFAVQCKRVSGDIGSRELQQLCGLLPKGTLGLFVTLSKFTAAARSFAQDNKSLILMDGHAFARFIRKVYRRMSKEHQELLAISGKEFTPSIPPPAPIEFT